MLNRILYTISRIIPYVLYLALLGFYHTAIAGNVGLLGARPLIGPILIALVAIYKPEIIAIWFAVAVAIVSNTGDAPATAIMMIASAGMALAAGFLKSRLNFESMTTRLAITLGVCLALEIVRIAVYATEGYAYIFFRYSLLSIALSLVAVFIFFLFKDRIITARRVRSIF